MRPDELATPLHRYWGERKPRRRSTDDLALPSVDESGRQPLKGLCSAMVSARMGSQS
jgi:hypothetical protein